MTAQTTGEFLDYWLETVMRNNIRQSTYMAYRGYIENHIRKRIGGEQLIELKVDKLQRLTSELQTEGGGLAAKTVRSIMLMLRGALEYAVDCEYIIKNPCDKVKLPKLEEKEVTVFDQTDQKRLGTAILQSEDRRHYGILIGLYTGLRIGELCGLKWESIDFENGTISIRASLNRVINYDG
ncbi:MAG: site-specific integrase, partial [Clostridiales bacterium]|nr:site-specific integrase [Clostridiales bacterium]